nr:DUF1289 domain-containing protein [Sphingomonas bacterium]
MSPCVGVCVIEDASGWCEGCGRTIDEIAGWIAMGEAARDGVMGELPSRMGELCDQPISARSAVQ